MIVKIPITMSTIVLTNTMTLIMNNSLVSHYHEHDYLGERIHSRD